MSYIEGINTKEDVDVFYEKSGYSITDVSDDVLKKGNSRNIESIKRYELMTEEGAMFRACSSCEKEECCGCEKFERLGELVTELNLENEHNICKMCNSDCPGLEIRGKEMFKEYKSKFKVKDIVVGIDELLEKDVIDNKEYGIFKRAGLEEITNSNAGLIKNASKDLYARIFNYIADDIERNTAISIDRPEVTSSSSESISSKVNAGDRVSFKEMSSGAIAGRIRLPSNKVVKVFIKPKSYITITLPEDKITESFLDSLQSKVSTFCNSRDRQCFELPERIISSNTK